MTDRKRGWWHEEARGLREQGWTLQEIADKFCVVRQTASFAVSEEVRRHRREYNQRPEVKERNRKYQREYHREYRKLPEVKEYYREYQREYQRKLSAMDCAANNRTGA